MPVPTDKHVLVDFDGTMAAFGGHNKGEPISPIMRLIRTLLNHKVDVRVFTARGTGPDPTLNRLKLEEVKSFCRAHFQKELPITSSKNELTHAIVDDRAVSVRSNTGVMVDLNNLLEDK